MAIVAPVALGLMPRTPRAEPQDQFINTLTYWPGAAREIDACHPSNTEGFRNCRFQNRFRSISLRLASSHTVFQLVSIASRCLSQMAFASSFESWK